MTLREVEVSVPLKTVSESNARDHWAKRNRRTQQARRLVGWALGAPLAEARKGLASGHVACVVLTLTRIAPRQLDDDNLRGALKAERVGRPVAHGLACDRDARLRWEYGQARGGTGQYAVKIAVRTELA